MSTEIKSFIPAVSPCLSLNLSEKPLEACRPLLTPPADDKRAVEGAGLASDQFQVMLGIELPFVVAEEPCVARYLSAVIEDVDPVDREARPGPLSRTWDTGTE